MKKNSMQKQLHCNLHALNTCEINNLLTHLNGTTTKYKFSNVRSRNFKSKYLLFWRLPRIFFFFGTAFSGTISFLGTALQNCIPLSQLESSIF